MNAALKSPVRILLVDDRTAGSNSITELVSALDLEIFTWSAVTTGIEALKLLMEQRYDACIVDLSIVPALAFISEADRIAPGTPILCAASHDLSKPFAVLPNRAASYIFREDLTVSILEQELVGSLERTQADQSNEKQVQRSERLYRRIVDEANEIIYRIDPSGHFTFVNPTAAGVVGRSVGDCIGRHFLSLIRPDYRDQTATFYRKQVRDKQPVSYFEFPAIVFDGSEVWIGQNVQLVIEEGAVVELQALGRDITVRKEIERQLVESEQRYRLLFDTNPHPMLVYELESLSFLTVNKAAIRSYGYSYDEFLRMTIADIRPPEKAHRSRDNFAEQGTLPDTWKHLKKSGSVIDVEIAAYPLVFDGKNAELITATDVTARVRAEAERQVMLEVIQSVSVTRNLDELLKRIHESLRKILYAENCFVALHDPATDLLHFEFWVDNCDDAPLPRPVGSGFTGYVLRTTQSLLLTAELANQMYDSGEVDRIGTSSASWLGVPLRTPSRTIGVLAVQHYEDERAYTESDRDFLSSVGAQIALAIERKRGEQALQEANRRAITEYERLLQRLATLAQSIGTARDLPTVCRALYCFAVESTPCNGMFVSLYDAERNERRAVYACADGIDISVSDLAPMPMSDSPHSRAVSTGQIVIEKDFQKAMAGKPVMNVGLEHDPRLPKSSLVIPMVIKGQVMGAVEIQSVEHAFGQKHITGMQMASNLAANAFENVRLLEQELAKEELLRQSQKMDAIGQLAGGVAHDFNNLLTVITGYSDLTLNRLEAGSPVRKNIEEIKKAGLRASSLTGQLLAFSRRQIMQTRILELNVVVADVDKMLRRLIGEDVDLVTLLHPDLGQVKADAGQIEQVLMNLVLNARDAMPAGGKLTIETANACLDKDYARAHPSVQPGQYVMLSVSDTGAGMDAAVKKQIFDPFFTTKEAGKGTGLGLSTVYGIVKQSGGSIWVYSEVGTGTTFKVYLPRFDEVPATEEAALKSHTASPGTETILLVEDEEMVRELAQAIFERNGYVVIPAANGEQGLDICKEFAGQIDLLVTDVVMPQMSGRKLAEKVARLRPDTRVLYMSGYTDDAIVRHGVLENGVAFIQKPFTPNALASKVREVLDQTIL